jgi:hypothetical protein
MMAGESLKGFSRFFTNLTPQQRQEIDRVLADLQNSKEMTSLDTSVRLLKRKVDQRLPIPQLIVKTSLRGATVDWAPLSDQRINFYEADITSISNFASFTTVPTYGIQIVVDGLRGTKYIRVRGIRRDGTTTPYSEVATITPTVFSVRSHSAEAFYIQLEGTSIHTLLGGPGSELAYSPINPDGNSMVWGFISAYADPASAMFGDSPVTASIMVKTTTAAGDETDVEELRVSFGEYFNSQNIGPFIVPHPDLGGTIEIRMLASDVSTTEALDARTQDSTEIMWCHLSVLEVGSG